MNAHPDAAGGSELPELPTFRGGSPLVDIADRDALYDAMERREQG